LKKQTNKTKSKRFQLVNYFTFASIGIFVIVAIALYYFVDQQTKFFSQVQTQQIDMVSRLQNSFAEQQETISRRDLLAVHEAGNVTLTRLFANSLWDEYIAPYVAEVTQIPANQCISMTDVEKDGKMSAPPAKKACFKAVGAEIKKNPGFELVNEKVFDATRGTSVFKIKVFDLRGITVYSSEHSQVGDSKIDNLGWQSAMKGIPASELTHRDTFSAFEGNVEDRDVISSYLPVYEPGTTDKLVGVFEIYSDVTPFLAQINETSANIQAIADDNLQQVQTRAALNQADIEKSSTTMFIIILGLLVVLFLALYLIVRRADRIIKEQEDEKEKGQMQLAQSEKMASLGQMVAGVAHQLNTPIAFSHSNLTMIKESVQEYEPVTRAYTKIAEHFSKTDKNRITLTMNKNKDELVERAENLPETAMITEMLDDTLNGLHQMGELVENLQNFTRLDRAKTDKFDVTSGLKNVIYIAKSVIPTGITINEAYANLPEVTCNPSQLNQVFLNLINNAAHALQGSGTINISTQQVGSNIEIKFEDNGTGIPPDVLPHIFDMYFTTKPEGEGTGMGLGIARTIAQEHGGDINVESTVNVGTIVTVTLPIDL
jgi:signal transduction histidine kinase